MLRIKDIKAYARETLLGKYRTAIGAYFLSGLMTGLCILLTLVSLSLCLSNTRRFESDVQHLIPSWKAVPALSVVFLFVFIVLIVFTLIFVFWAKIGRQKLILNICRGQSYKVSDIFYAFRAGSHPFKIIGLLILQQIFVRLPGILPFLLKAAAKVSGYRETSFEQMVHNPWGIAILVVSFLTSIFMIYLSIGFVFGETILIDRPETDVMDALKESLHLMRWKKLKFIWMLITFIFWAILMSLVPIAGLWVSPFIEAAIVIFYLSARGEKYAVPAIREAEIAASWETEEEKAEETPAAEAETEVPVTEEPEAPAAEAADVPAAEEPEVTMAEEVPVTEEAPGEEEQPAAEEKEEETSL